MKNLCPIEWTPLNQVLFLRQDLLPHTVEHTTTDNYQVLVEAIKKLQIRGAPLIGVGAAMAFALASWQTLTSSLDEFRDDLEQVYQEITASRPTAKNLFTALNKMRGVLYSQTSITATREALKAQATAIMEAEIAYCQKIAKNGVIILPQGGVLTHCNTGALACGATGTALGVIVEAYKMGKVSQVLVDETRPLLQGARLTTFELQQASVPYRLISDNMAAWAMQNNLVQSVIVGADRIAQNGDTANKIGTYGLAILAREHHIPFFVAAPTTTFDISSSSGDDIIIEERDENEVTTFWGNSTSVKGTRAYNPAFDVTPARFISAIISEKGVYYPPYNFIAEDIS